MTAQSLLDAALPMAARRMWAPVAVLILHWLVYWSGGYTWYPNIDSVIHVLGGMSMAYLLSGVLQAGRDGGAIQLSPRWLELLLMIAATALVAIGWEFFELTLDTLAGTQLLGDLGDTLADLFFGLLGAAGYALIYAHGGRARNERDQ